jgi:hypothetical protein
MLSESAYDLLDLEEGVALAVALGPAIIFLGLVLEDYDLLTLDFILDRSLDHGSGDVGSADLDLIARDENDLVQGYRGAFFGVETIDREESALFGVILLSVDFYDCVHFR